MDFADKLSALATRISKQIGAIQTEEAAKTAFVMPFIQALGYDVFDPTEVIPEFIADVGSKKGEKIDYAIMVDGQPSLLFECKGCSANLQDCHASQLRRYFHVTSARIGVLTNGVVYMFFSDLDQKNIMDEKPFLEINLFDIDERLIPELKKLSKSTFELEQMLSTASNLKYTRQIKNFFEAQLSAPTNDFIKVVLVDIYSGMKTQQVLEQFAPLVKQALVAVITDHINARLKSAMTNQVSQVEPVVAAENVGACCDEPIDKGIVTTQEEFDGFYIVKSILRQSVDVKRIFYRDTKSYFGILLDDSNRKTVCRLHFNTSQKYIGIIGADKKETKNAIDSLDDIYNFSDQLNGAVKVYDIEP